MHIAVAAAVMNDDSDEDGNAGSDDDEDDLFHWNIVHLAKERGGKKEKAL